MAISTVIVDQWLCEHRHALVDQIAELDGDIMALRLKVAELQQVDAAQTRLRTGQYGLCELCQEKIDHNRLEAMPWTPYCLNCSLETNIDDRLASVAEALEARDRARSAREHERPQPRDEGDPE